MAGQKYPSRSDVEALTQANQFLSNIGTPAESGLTADDITRLQDATSDGQSGYDLHVTTQQAARANRIAKDEKMKLVRSILSELNQRVQVFEGTTDTKRGSLGIPIYDKTPSKDGAPDELPFVTIDTSTPMAQYIFFSDADGKGKPDGARAAEIYFKLGGAATGNLDDYRYLGQDTEEPYFKEFTDPADAGKQAHYMICWVNNKGERGAFRLASATVTSLLQTELP